MKLSVIGLGKLGSVIAAVYAEAGHEVVGVDTNLNLVNDLNKGKAPVQEPGLHDLIQSAGDRLRATTDVAEAVAGSEATYVIVPTPSDSDGFFVNDFLSAALKQIGQSIRSSDQRHTVIICSTVMPGSCDGELREVLEAACGMEVGRDVGLVYSPEFIALGSVVKDMHEPDLILIGESDPESGALAERNALSVVKNKPAVRRMNLINAEITKISINTFVTLKISFANMLSELCDNLANADVDVVTQAVGSDSRIGLSYLKGALGYGGPCFPRDNVALTRLAERLGLDAPIPRATDMVNERQISRVLALLRSQPPSDTVVAVLGLAYKPDTPVSEKSQGVGIANALCDQGYSVIVFDPLVNGAHDPELNPAVIHAPSLLDAVKPSRTVIVSTPSDTYRALTADQLRNKLVIDPWRVLDESIPAIRLGKLRAKSASTLERMYES